jgi:hypothetical protein
MYKLSLSAVLLFAAVCPAQQVRQQALGFVFDSGTASVRPLWGVPGAAHVGNPLDLGGDISVSAASPHQDYVVLLAGPTHAARIWSHDTLTVTALSGVRPGATAVVLSQEGGAAAFYYPDSSQIHVVTGLPSAPVTAFDADLSALMNPLGAFAVSEDGTLLLAAERFVDGNAAPSAVLFRAAAVPLRIPVSGPASALAFLANSHDVLISAAAEALLIRDAAVQANRVVLPSAANSATAILPSADGSRAFFADSRSGAVSVVSLLPGDLTSSTLDCVCALTGIARTAAPSVFRLTEDAAAPVALLDASSPQPRLLIVPPVVNPVVTPDNH